MIMIISDKIIEERRRLGLSQEELAERLGVSRQAVSKWEGAQSAPDLQRVIQMSELFGVTTDYLLKDSIESCERQGGSAESESSVHTVSMEEANAYLEMKKRSACHIPTAVSLCILSPVPLITLVGLANAECFGLSEKPAAVIGLVALFAMAAAAVMIFIFHGSEMKQFESIEREPIETAYGVSGLVSEKSREFRKSFTAGMAFGIILCALSPLPLITVSILRGTELSSILMTSLLLVLCAVGVFIIVRMGIISSGYDSLLKKGEYTNEKKAENRKNEGFSGAYWCCVTALYLVLSFLTERWDITWLVWAGTGVLFPAMIAIRNRK